AGRDVPVRSRTARGLRTGAGRGAVTASFRVIHTVCFLSFSFFFFYFLFYFISPPRLQKQLKWHFGTRRWGRKGFSGEYLPQLRRSRSRIGLPCPPLTWLQRPAPGSRMSTSSTRSWGRGLSLW
ncbi:hypothetical protein INR49_017175, partial [Caranx melampygus]